MISIPVEEAMILAGLTEKLTLTPNQRENLHAMSEIIWVFGTYHKTGCELTRAFLTLLGGPPVHNNWVSAHDKSPDIFSSKPFSNWFPNPELSIITALPRYRHVHMIRMPLNVIVSAYRYHCE